MVRRDFAGLLFVFCLVHMPVFFCLKPDTYKRPSSAWAMDALVYILLARLKAHTFVQTFAKIGPEASTARASGGTSPSGQDMKKVGKPVQKPFLKVSKASQLLPKNAIKQTQPLKAPSETKISVVAYKYSVKAMLLVERCPNVEL